MKDRKKELKYLIYLKNEIIKQEKKELKELRKELSKLNEEESINKRRNKIYKKYS